MIALPSSLRDVGDARDRSDTGGDHRLSADAVDGAGDDGTVGVHPDLIRDLFLQDCDEATIEQALARLTRQSVTPFMQSPRQIAWHHKPASYFVCLEDLATPAEVQHQRVRGDARAVEFDAGHHPFLSRPDAFADLIAAEIDRAG